MRLRIACSIFVLVLAVSASAQNRVFVSAQHGDDSFACSVTAPCRSFAHALTVVATNGEILALDSGGYGTVSISKNVSIVAPPGVEASITQSVMDLNAIDINAGANLVVLRGLSLFGNRAANDGIAILAGNNNVVVQSCNFTGFAGSGIEYNVSAPSYLTVMNSTFTQNYMGIQTAASADNLANFAIEHVHMEISDYAGLYCHEGSRGLIRDSLASVAIYGIYSTVFYDGRTAKLDVENCSVTRASSGIGGETSGTGVVTIRVSNSLIVNNTLGISHTDANTHIWTRSNNSLADNDTDGTFTNTYTGQ